MDVDVVDPVIGKSNIADKETDDINMELDGDGIKKVGDVILSTDRNGDMTTEESKVMHDKISLEDDEKLHNSNQDKSGNHSNAETSGTHGGQKRRHSDSDNDNEIKKSKIDIDFGKNDLDKQNVTEIFKEKGLIDKSKDDTDDLLKRLDEIESSNLNTPTDESDDLLERLDAIDATNLRKPDLKIDEIDTTDLEKDDLLKRLEEAENGVEESPVDEVKKHQSITDKTEDLTTEKLDGVSSQDKTVDLTSDTDDCSMKDSQEISDGGTGTDEDKNDTVDLTSDIEDSSNKVTRNKQEVKIAQKSQAPPDSSTSEASSKDDTIEIQSSPSSEADSANENSSITIDSSDEAPTQKTVNEEKIQSDSNNSSSSSSAESCNLPSSSDPPQVEKSCIDETVTTTSESTSANIAEDLLLDVEALPEASESDLNENKTTEAKDEVSSSAQSEDNVLSKNESEVIQKSDENNVSTSKEKPNVIDEISPSIDTNDTVSTSEKEHELTYTPPTENIDATLCETEATQEIDQVDSELSDEFEVLQETESVTVPESSEEVEMVDDPVPTSSNETDSAVATKSGETDISINVSEPSSSNETEFSKIKPQSSNDLTLSQPETEILVEIIPPIVENESSNDDISSTDKPESESFKVSVSDSNKTIEKVIQSPSSATSTETAPLQPSSNEADSSSKSELNTGTSHEQPPSIEPDSPTKLESQKSEKIAPDVELPVEEKKVSVDKDLGAQEKLSKESLLNENEAKDLHQQETLVITDKDSENAMEVDDEPEQILYSDSTASINSTSEEVIVKFSKETSNSQKMDQDSENTENIDVDKEPVKHINKDKLFSNVLLMNNGSSTPNSNNTSGIFNTPIEKNFEISSENVSKISGNINVNLTTDQSEDVVMADTTDDYVDSHTENTEDKSEMATTTEHTDTDGTDTQSSAGITAFTKTIKELNGLSPNSETSDDSKTDNVKCEITEQSKSKQYASTNGMNLDLYLSNETSEDCLYEISVWYEENEMKFLSVEKIDRAKKFGRMTPLSDLTGTDSSGKHSSNGSVGSLGPFSLPPSRLSAVSLNSSSSGSQKGHEGKFAVPSLPQKSKQTIKGVTSLCNFMIEHFTKIKHNLAHDEDEQNADNAGTTPKARGREATKKNIIKNNASFSGDDAHESPEIGKLNKKKISSSDVSSSSAADEIITTPVKSKPGSAKKGNKSASKVGQFLVPATETVLDLSSIGVSVLARWIDKKYYAGKVIEVKPGNKFVIKFEDGATKTLTQDVIVFGDEFILPLQDQSIYALVDDDYEAGIVTSFETENDITYYNVLTSEKTVRVTGSDIYLTDEQAKQIQDIFKNESISDIDGDGVGDADGKSNKKTPRTIAVKTPVAVTTGRGRGRKGDRSASQTPEAGFSGGVVAGKKGRRAKRPSKPQSESSDISDTMESDSAPNSPDSALEAVDGVQPELQKTPKESQINKMDIITKYLGVDGDKAKNPEEIFGPIPTNKTLFRNKHFILTCTISMKERNENSVEGKDDETEKEDMCNKYRKFTSMPFIKEHLRKQIEEGGGKIYNHFEDVPKNKYKQCKLIAPHPCATAKYVQCLAAEIPAVSHEWIIESCRKGTLADTKAYALPSGWSIIEERYIKWAVGRSSDQRHSANPLSNQIVLLAALNKDFSEFWTRVCKLAGATIRVIKSPSDITQSQSGFMLTEEEFPDEIKQKAEHFGIPVVSTVWVVQSLILGKACKPEANKKLTQMYQDDDY